MSHYDSDPREARESQSQPDVSEQYLLEAIGQGLSSLPQSCDVPVPAASERFRLVSPSHSKVTFTKIHFEPLLSTGKVRKCQWSAQGSPLVRVPKGCSGRKLQGRTPREIWGRVDALARPVLWWSSPRRPCSPSPGLGRGHGADGGSEPLLYSGAAACLAVWVQYTLLPPPQFSRFRDNSLELTFKVSSQCGFFANKHRLFCGLSG